MKTIALILMLCGWADAQPVPERIAFQGRLTDAINNPLAGPQGMVFRVFDSETGGTQLWTETQPAVPVTNGVFSVHLGSVTPLNYAVFNGNSAWLEITVNGNTLSPRERLVTVPYAFGARLLDGREYAHFVSTAGVAQTVAGDKTFSGTLSVPAPGLPAHAATKAYVDAQIGGAGGWTKAGAVVALADPADNAVVQSTLTVQGDAFSVGGSTLTVRGGQVGLGVSNPGAKLEINSVVGEIAQRIRTPVSQTASTFEIRNSANQVVWHIDRFGKEFAWEGLEVKEVATDGSIIYETNSGLNTNTMRSRTNGSIPLTIEGQTGQAEPMTLWRNSAGVPLAVLERTGQFTTVSTVTVQGDAFSVGGSTLVVSAGRVGIGLTDPLDLLELSGGDLRVQTGSALRGLVVSESPTLFNKLAWDGNNDAAKLLFKGGDLQIDSDDQAGAELTVSRTGGRVGVFTSAPQTTLDVNGNAQFGSGATKSTFSAAGTLTFPAGYSPANPLEAASKAYVDAQIGGAGGWTRTGAVVSLAAPSDNAVVQSTLTVQGSAFSVGGSTLAVWSGRLGVGVTNPGAELHVRGNETRLQNTGHIVTFYDTPGTRKAWLQASGNDFFIGNDSDASVRLATLGIDRLTAHSSGVTASAALSVGGAALSNGTLVVRSTSTTGGNPILSLRSNAGTEQLRVHEDGTVGMGTTSPTLGALHVNRPAILERPNNASTYGMLQFQRGVPGLNWTIETTGDGAGGISLLTLGGPSGGLGIASGGNVGVGTSAPSAKLDVNGSAQFGSGATKSTFSTAGVLTFPSGYTPANPLEAANKAYVDAQIGGAGGWTKTGAVVSLASPSDNAVVQSTLTVQGSAFSVGDTTFVVSGGRIGVGTSMPAAKIHLSSGALLLDGSNATILVPTGSAAAPSYSRAGDPDTGMYFGGSDQIEFGTGGTLRMTVHASGISASTNFSTTGQYIGGSGSVGAPAYRFGADASMGLYRAAANELGISANSAEVARFTPNGLTMASNADVTLSGANGYITTASSINASAFFGDGSGLTGVAGTDSSRVLKAGDTMTGALTMSGASANIVSGSSITTAGGLFGQGAGITALNASNLASGTVNDGRLSSNVTLLNGAQSFTGAKTFSNVGLTMTGASGNIVSGSSITTSGGFFGDGSGLTGVTGTDSSRVLKAGDTMTGALTMSGASANIVSGSSITTTGGLFGQGAGITALNASNLASGIVPLARLSGITNTEIAAGAAIADTKLGTISTAGKVSDSALSSNVALLNSAQTFTSAKTFNNASLTVVASSVTSRSNGSGLPATSGTSQTASLRLGASGGVNVVLDFGAFTSGAAGTWLQSTNQTSLVSNYDLLLNPNGGNVGIGTTAPSTKLDVNGNAQFGSGATKSTFSATGALTLAPSSGLTLSGPTGNITTGSSVTASAFFGSGAALTGVTATDSSRVLKVGDTMTGTLTFSGVATDLTSVSNQHIAIMPNGTGMVGVGTTAPSSTMTVAGSLGLTAIGAPNVSPAGEARIILDSADNTLKASVNGGAYGPLGGGGSSNWTITGADIYRNSNVGVGSTSPAAKLHVSSGALLLDGTNAKLLVPNGTAAAPSLAFAGATNTGIYRDAANILVLVTNGSPRLHAGGGTPEVFLYSKLLFQDSTNDIGEASQYQPRHVRFQGDLQGTKASADAVSALFTGRKNRGTLLSPTALSSGDDLLALSGQGYVGGTGGYVEAAKILLDSEGAVADTATGIGGVIAFQTRASGAALLEAMRITSGGDVGIGSTNPGAKLEVGGALNLKSDGANTGELKVGYTAAAPAGYYATYAP